MENYENMNIEAVERLAKQGDKNALYEMVWRYGESSLMLPEHRGNSVEECAWQDYWFEKAAMAGHIAAKAQYARSLINRSMDKDWREKAMELYQDLVNDFDAGKLSGDDREWGPMVKLRLGIMLCEGYHTQRDAIKGARLIKEAEDLTKGFSSYGYKSLNELGELYAIGLAQPYEDPSIADLVQAVKYFAAAINRFNHEKDDPNNRGFLNLTQQFFEKSKERIVSKVKLLFSIMDVGIPIGQFKDFLAKEEKELSDEEKDKRRTEMMKLPDASIERIKADKEALKRLKERFAREGW